MVVVVYARTFDDRLASMVKGIDRVVKETGNPNSKVGFYVNFLGDDFERLKIAAAEFGEKHKINHVPLVVPGDPKIGGYVPKGMRIHADAEVTVIIYQSVVKASHAFAKGSLNPKAVTRVITDIEKHLQ